MKKILYILGILSLGLLNSCQKLPIEMTATVEMAGEWVVSVDASANGQVIYEDPYGFGTVKVFTSNSAANIATEMLVLDDPDDPFWNFNCKVTADPANMSFSANAVENLAYDCEITITGGKIVKNGTKTPSGMPADYIEFHILFSDDDTAAEGVWDDLFIHGYRYTGLASDN